MGVLFRCKTRPAGKEDADAANQIAVLKYRNAAGQGADAARLRVGQKARNEPIRFRGREALVRRNRRRDQSQRHIEATRQENIVGRPADMVGPGTNDAVAVGVLDFEQVNLRRERHIGREVSPNADGRHETRSAPRRIRICDVRIGIYFPLRDRALADELDSPRGQRGLIVGEERRRACLRQSAVDRECQVRGIAKNLRSDAGLDAHTEHPAATVHDGDDAILAG